MLIIVDQHEHPWAMDTDPTVMAQHPSSQIGPKQLMQLIPKPSGLHGLLINARSCFIRLFTNELPLPTSLTLITFAIGAAIFFERRCVGNTFIVISRGFSQKTCSSGILDFIHLHSSLDVFSLSLSLSLSAEDTSNDSND